MKRTLLMLVLLLLPACSDLLGDHDGDGFVSCDDPRVEEGSDCDCDDGDADISPAMPDGSPRLDSCDSIDNNCDGEVDEDAPPLRYFIDEDGDGWGNVQDPGELSCDSVEGKVTRTDDCNDSDPSIEPNVEDKCDYKDNDCDGRTDEDEPPQIYYLDYDGDGWGDQNDTPLSLCQPDAQRVANNLDCDDNNLLKNPGEEEVCDGLDNDCNGESDDNAPPLTWWLDIDGDGYGGDAYSVQQCARPPGYSDLSGDCNDHDVAFHPGAGEICSLDAIDYNCDGSPGRNEDPDKDGDADEDGYEACDDCNDGNNAVYPGAAEVCNGIDDNCNHMVDDVGLDNRYRDRDLDTFAADQQEILLLEGCPIGWTDRVPNDVFSQDCDDVNSATFPGAMELCDLQDNDCDGSLSAEESDTDGDGVPACAQENLPEDCNNGDDQQSPLLEEVCDGIDNDCDELIPANELDLDGDGVTECGGDCNDQDRDSFPGATETCDGRDNNCDGTVDEGAQLTLYPDQDGDGFGVTEGELLSCTPVEGYANKPGDCDDANPAINPSAPEVLEDGSDNNCDGEVDKLQACLYPDADEDGIGAVQEDCENQNSTLEQFSTLTGDCDDANAASYPGAPETCDGADNDCDEAVDEGAQDTSSWYPDADDDGYGVTSGLVKTCTAPEDYVATPGDCDDEDSSTHPGAEELPDLLDNDCDGLNERGEIPPESVDVVVSPSGEDSPSDIPGATSLQDAVDIAVGQTSECVTVLVEEGTYRGSLVIEDQCVTIVSVGGAENTILIADATVGSVFQVVRGSLTLKGFTLQGGTGSPGKEGACFEGNTNESAGGGICARDTTLMANDLILSGNTAGYGGGLYLKDSTATLSDAQILGNSGVEEGGGLYFIGTTQALRLTNVDFVNNYAISEGGGVFVQAAGEVTLSVVSFERNSSSIGGGATITFGSGAIIEASKLEFSNNTSQSNGAGLSMSLESGSVSTWSGLTFTDNNAGNHGGGLYLSTASAASAVLEDLTFTGNNSSTRGGGLYASLGANTTLHHLALTNNAAFVEGGALFLSGDGKLEDVEIKNASAYSGGGIYLEGSTQLNRVRITGGRASSGGGVKCVSSQRPVLRNLQLLANEATAGGGGIYLAGSSTCNIHNATIARNWAWGGGGGIMISSASPTISNSIVAYNGVAGKGSNIYTDSSTYILTDSLLYTPPGDEDNLYGVSGFVLDNNRILQVEPRFIRDVRYGAVEYLDVHLRPDSPARDMGLSSTYDNDPDGSRNDIGAFGGPESSATDDDSDGLPDDWEAQYGLDPAINDSAEDDDGDGLNNAEEYADGLVPTRTDTDKDGVDDLDEQEQGTHPLDHFDFVPGEAPVMAVPKDLSSIQSALDYAFPRTVIRLSPGTYKEDLHAAFKPITLEGEEGRDQTILQGDGSQSVIVLHAMEEGTELHGLTITGGIGSNDGGELAGGGMFVQWSFLSLSDLTITDNSAINGGGMRQVGGTSKLTYTIFKGNWATNGGGMSQVDGTTSFIHTLFSDNSATNGGGMNLFDVTSTITHTLFVNNEAVTGGGIVQHSGTNTITHTLFADNEAENGGGMYQFKGSSSITHTVFIGNSAFEGGGIRNDGALTLKHSILAFNIGNAPYENWYMNCPTARSGYNLYYTTSGDDGTNCPLSSTDLPLDPLFLNRANGDYHLAPNSPLINAGDPSELDPDRSRADIGLYGGPGADDFDLDGDNFPDYYWPGGYANTPSGETRVFDCDDADPEAYPGQGC